MPKAFDTWKVFPHRPLEKLTENLWRVEGDLPGNDGSTRVMTLARLGDGRLVIHNAVALEEELMKEIEAFGTPAAIIVPNGYHRLDAKVFKQRYPEARVYCPRGARSKVEQVVTVDGSYEEAPHDDRVRLFHLDGTKEGEGVLEVQSDSGTALTFNDAFCNLAPVPGFMGFLLAPTGKPSVPRIGRWIMVKDKESFRAHLTRLASTERLARLIVSHGKMITEAPKATLEAVASAL